jgi:hypothetical protein
MLQTILINSEGKYLVLDILILCHGATVPVGQGLLIAEAIRLHLDTPYSDRSTLDGWSARPTTLSRDSHASGRIRTHNPSKRTAAKTHALDRAAIGIGR